MTPREMINPKEGRERYVVTGDSLLNGDYIESQIIGHIMVFWGVYVIKTSQGIGWGYGDTPTRSFDPRFNNEHTFVVWRKPRENEFGPVSP